MGVLGVVMTGSVLRYAVRPGAVGSCRSGAGQGVGGAAADAGADALDVDRAGVGGLDLPGLDRQLQLQQALAEAVLRVQLHGVDPGEAGRAAPLAGLVGGGDHAVLADVAEAVGADAGADLLDAEAGGDELGPGGEVDAVEARPAHRRAGDAHVHLGGARLAQHPHQRPLGVAAHDRVVDNHQALAADDIAQGVELEPDAQLADGLARRDESAPDVGVLDQPLAVGDAGLLGVADRRGRAGLRRRHDHVGVDRVLPGQLPAYLDPGLVHAATVDRGVRAGEVDVLEDAALGLGLGEPARAQAVGVDRDQLAGLDLADH